MKTITCLMDAAVFDFWLGVFAPAQEVGLVLDKLKHSLKCEAITTTRLIGRVKKQPAHHLEIEVFSVVQGDHAFVRKIYPPPSLASFDCENDDSVIFMPTQPRQDGE